MKNIIKGLGIALIAVITSCTMAFAQAKGIQFEAGKTWQEVLTKARAEHKFIFVDCFATWCGPCKMMDRNVYPNDSVGQYMNSRFVSVEIQFDTSKRDNDTVKMLYADAHRLKTEFKIHAFPTYLFFDSEGRLVNRDQALRTPVAFIQIAAKAADNHYYERLADYRSGKKDYHIMPELAAEARRLGQEQTAREVASDYLHNYLDKLDERSFLTKANLDFIGENQGIITSADRIFLLSYQKSALVDTLLGKGTAKRTVEYIVYKEEIEPHENKGKLTGKEPDWAQIQKNIKRKYPEAGYTEDNILAARVSWYRFKKDAANYTKYLVIETDADFKAGEIKFSDVLAVAFLNNTAMEVFNYSNRRPDLERALVWMKKVNESSQKPDNYYLDTQAGLLYKLGRKTKALQLEQRAVSIDPKDNAVGDDFAKMKKGEKTWLDKMK